ncbi:MAG: Stage sporulation protein [Planctomycetota bacterium]|jgi:S-DNA-T family DNA segregation ATPase FtsK/SpoIIIE
MAKSARNASTRKRASGGSSSVLSAFDRNIGWLRAGWVLAATALAIVMLSLASFNPADPPSLAVAQPNDPPVNLCGRFGASVAYRLYEIFGVGAWIPVGYLSVWLGFIAMGRAMTHPFVRLVGAMMMMLAFGGLHNEWIPTVGPVAGYEAGLIPKALSVVVHEHFGFGATLIFLVMLGIGAVVMADSLVKKIPDAVAQALDFLGPILKTDWSEKVGSIRERAGAMFPQPAVATAGRSRRATAKAADVEEDEEEGGVATAEADDEEADDAEIEDSEDAEVDADEEEVEEATPKAAARAKAAAPEPVAATPAPRTDDELRAKIAKLPVKVNTKSPAKAAKDGDIPRTPDYSGYQFPTLELLDNPEGNYSEKAAQLAQEQALVLTKTLNTYGINGEISGIECGPVVTVYSVELEAGTRVARLETIAKDIARALTAPNVRIIPNMAGSTAVGIEVPNKQKEKVRLKELMSGGQASNMMLPMFMGKDSSGEPLVLDLAKMPHMLIAGTTGSGKSVCMNTIIMSFLYTKRPDELKLVLVDPKMVEMAMFADIPHLACPVVTEMGKAAAILEWAVTKMEERYELLKEAGVRDIKGFNAMTEDELRAQMNVTDDGEWARVMKKMPYMVFVIDELADLMMTNKEVEQSIVRIAQKARAVGIHLILATQRPQATVVTGLIKSNMPCRVAFKVASGTDSRIVLDQKGAELLLGQGDMLVVTPSKTDASRCQGTLVEDREARGVVKFLKSVAEPSFERQLLTLRAPSKGEGEGEGGADAQNAHKQDELFDKAVEIMIESGRGSVSLLQRRLAIGYGRASRLVDLMGQAGLLGEHKGSQAREVIVTMDEWHRMKELRDQQEREGTVFEGTGSSDDDDDALRMHDEDGY